MAYWEDDEIYAKEDNQTQYTIVTVLYLFVLSIGLIANLAFCVIVIRKKHLRTAINCVFLNLALADIISAIALAMLSIAYNNEIKWMMEKLTCHLLMYFSWLSRFFTAVAIAMPFVIILFSQTISVRRVNIIIGCLWISAAWAAIHTVFTTIYSQFEDGAICYTSDTNYTVITKVYLAFPITIVISSVIIHKVLRKSVWKEISACRSMIALIIIFYVCFLPFSLITGFEVINKMSNRNFVLLGNVSSFFYVIVLMYKPFLYLLFVDDLKAEMKKMLPCCCKRESEENH